MKLLIKQLSLIILALLLMPSSGSAQDVTGGMVKYEQMNFIEFDYTPTGNAQRDNFFANLPGGKKVGKILYFNTRNSLYETDPDANIAALEDRTAMIMERISLGSAPAGVLQTAYLDNKKGERTDVIELMTRLFQIKNKIEPAAWKPGTEQRKILDYVCLDASYKEGEHIVTAWFTTEIPYSFGPGKYYGLPGLILAVEVDGKNEMLATDIDLTQSVEDKINKPSEGKKTSQEEYDAILAQKIEEWEKERENRGVGSDRR